MLSIALIDDHPLAVNGIGAWLSATGRFAIAGTAGTLAEASALLEQLDPLPAIVILDISLGTEDGLDFIPVLKDICLKKNKTPPYVLVCSMYEDPFLIKNVMDSGAQAYVSKSAKLGEIITAIDAILAGNIYINPKYKIETQEYALTHRENDIVFMVKQSLSNRQIADRLKISVRTVENHLAHIYVKTKTVSRGELFNL
jgi:DNA-binding NarL/FixJ family response regulator